MSYSDDLNRLIRAGDEASKTNAKLVLAAVQVADIIVQALRDVVCLNADKNQASIGRGYFIRGTISPLLVYVDGTKPSAGDILFLPSTIKRDDALKLSGALADGWLGELCERLDVHRRTNDRAMAVLGAAGNELRAGDTGSGVQPRTKTRTSGGG